MKTRTNNGAVIDLEDKPSRCFHRTYAGRSLIVDNGFIYPNYKCEGSGEEFGEDPPKESTFPFPPTE